MVSVAARRIAGSDVSASDQRNPLRSVIGPMLCTSAWIIWSYLRLRPTAAVTSTHPPLVGYGPWAFSHFAYSDLLALYQIHHLGDHAFPYVHTVIEYPVLTGLFMWCAAWVPGVGGYFLASCLGLLACALGCVYFLQRLSPTVAWIFGLSPLLLTYALLNWDLLAILLMLAGWDCFRRRRYGLSGALFSVAVCAKFFPLFLLLFCVVSCFARRDDLVARRGGARMLVAAAVTALVLNLPFALANFAGWTDFLRFNATRGAGDGLLLELHVASAWPIAAVDAVSALIVLAVVVALARWVLRGAPVLTTAAAALAFFMLMNKVFSPQYMLWVFVFALLAEWPGWALAAIAFAGLTDYANAMITLHLVAVRSHDFPWYFTTVFPLNRAVRMAAIASGLLGSTWLAWRSPSAGWHRHRGGVAPAIAAEDASKLAG